MFNWRPLAYTVLVLLPTVLAPLGCGGSPPAPPADTPEDVAPPAIEMPAESPGTPSDSAESEEPADG